MISNNVEFYSDDVVCVRKNAYRVFVVKCDNYVMIVRGEVPACISNWVLNTYVAQDTTDAYNKWLHWTAKMCKKDLSSKYFAKYTTCPSFTNGYVPDAQLQKKLLGDMQEKLMVVDDSLEHKDYAGDKTSVMKQYLDGRVGTCVLGYNATLMCPVCYNIYPIIQSGAVSVKAEQSVDMLTYVGYHIQCPTCGKDVTAVVLDPPIAIAVARLNSLGYKTEMSCGGHADDEQNPAFIKFDRVYEFETLPMGWKVQGVFLRAKTTVHSLAIKYLNEWIETLHR